jgi:DNA-directed RNA polymerase specialized sigma24 family protein
MARPGEAEFTEFVRAHGPALLRTATLLTGDRGSGADLARTALARSYPHSNGDQLARARRFLVAGNLNRLHRLARGEQVIEALPETGEVRSDEFRTALRDLPPRERAAVVLRYLDGLGETEAADVLGCPLESVRDDADRGLAALRGLLEPAEGREPGEQLAARLHALADELVGRGEAPDPEVVLATHRQRRRRRAGLVAAAAAALAVALGMPALNSSLSSAAAPAGATSEPPGDARGHHGDADAAASASAAMWSAERSAAAAAAQAAGQPELEAVRSRLPSSVVLTAPADWAGWLPEGRSRQATAGEDTCPAITKALSAGLGEQMGYWTGSLPMGPRGCTWVPVPAMDGAALYDYAYVLDIGFLGDGTTAADLGHSGSYVGRTRGIPVPCARLDLGAGGLLVRCEGSTPADDASWTMVVPDARGAGVWVLNAYARTDAALPSSDAFVALVGAAVGAYG